MAITYRGMYAFGTNAERTGGSWVNFTQIYFYETDTGNTYYWVPSTWTVVSGPSATQTLTNKTLTAPVISTISNTGTLTLPTSTDTLVGKATTDIFTNKSMDALTNTFDNVVVSPFKKKWGMWEGTSATTAGAVGMWSAAGTGIASGTGAVVITTDATGVYCLYSSGATINSLNGTRVNVGKYTCRALNTFSGWRMKLTQTTACRAGFGYSSASNASPATGADPLPNLSGVLYWYDSAIDGNWHISQNDGSATSDTTTIAAVAAADTSVHDIYLKSVAASNKFQYSYNASGTAPTSWTDISTKIPAAATSLGWWWWIENTTAANKTMPVYCGVTYQDA